MKYVVNLLVMILPWPIKRKILNIFYKYNLHPKARIGFSYIYPDYLEMEEGACIGHLNVAIHLNKIIMKKNSSIRQQNWITGYPLTQKKHFQDFPDRRPELIMGEDSGITKKHHIDCTDRITIGKLTTVAGYNTQILTHSVSVEHNEQSCAPIIIGHHCFVGTRSVLLPGAILPDQSVLGAGAVLNKKFSESFALYGGVPAKFIKKMDESYSFFHRSVRPK